MTAHFTAWLTTDRTCLASDRCDITVLADKRTHPDEDEWVSTGDPLWHTETSHTVDTDDDSGAVEEAKELLARAGWVPVGDWKAVPTGYILTVERDRALADA